MKQPYEAVDAEADLCYSTRWHIAPKINRLRDIRW